MTGFNFVALSCFQCSEKSGLALCQELIMLFGGHLISQKISAKSLLQEPDISLTLYFCLVEFVELYFITITSNTASAIKQDTMKEHIVLHSMRYEMPCNIQYETMFCS